MNNENKEVQSEILKTLQNIKRICSVMEGNQQTIDTVIDELKSVNTRMEVINEEVSKIGTIKWGLFAFFIFIVVKLM